MPLRELSCQLLCQFLREWNGVRRDDLRHAGRVHLSELQYVLWKLACLFREHAYAGWHL